MVRGEAVKRLPHKDIGHVDIDREDVNTGTERDQGGDLTPGCSKDIEDVYSLEDLTVPAF